MYPDGSIITPGLPIVSQPFNAKTNPAVGVFLYRNEVNIGTGDVNYTNVQLRWNYGINGLADNENVEVSVFAIEMVYIPQGSFYVGDEAYPGSSSTGRFVAGNTTENFLIDSEDELTINNNADTELWAISTSGYSTIGVTGVLPAVFPKGFQSFYIMKYELSQYMYKEFLNKLTRTQQEARVSAKSHHKFMGNGANHEEPQNRNGIRVMTESETLSPHIYGNDLNNNGTEGEPEDGQHIACNWLSFHDLLAFADWSGLRPFTELEYEKACRGTAYPTLDECAWGTVEISCATGIDNPGATNECATNKGANIAFNNVTDVKGPMRCGCFADSATNRIQAGATYYGVMEMSGNLWEYTYSIGLTSLNPISNDRAFNGKNHGDGIITKEGEANVNNWPTRAGIRGASWISTEGQQVSSRVQASAPQNSVRHLTTGIRLARTQP